MTPKIFLKLFFLGDNKVLTSVLAVLIALIHVSFYAHFFIAGVLLIAIALVALILMVSNYRIAYNHHNWGPISQPVTDGRPE